MLDHAKNFACVDAHFDEHVAKLQGLVRQPSISPEQRGIRECAALVRLVPNMEP